MDCDSTFPRLKLGRKQSISLGSWKPLTYSRNRKKTVTRICVVNGFVRPISVFFDKEIGRAFRALTNPLTTNGFPRIMSLMVEKGQRHYSCTNSPSMAAKSQRTKSRHGRKKLLVGERRRANLGSSRSLERKRELKMRDRETAWRPEPRFTR